MSTGASLTLARPSKAEESKQYAAPSGKRRVQKLSRGIEPLACVVPIFEMNSYDLFISLSRKRSLNGWMVGAAKRSRLVVAVHALCKAQEGSKWSDKEVLAVGVLFHRLPLLLYVNTYKKLWKIRNRGDGHCHKKRLGFELVPGSNMVSVGMVSSCLK
jgi:hypothetical protein